jgi:hypothetical protein
MSSYFCDFDVKLILFKFKAAPGSHCQVSVILQLHPAVTSTTFFGLSGCLIFGDQLAHAILAG